MMAENTLQYSLESDTDYLMKLQQLVVAGSVLIRFDAGKLRGMDSPVVVIAETERWAMGMVALCGAVWWFFGLWPATGAAVLSVLAYVFLGRQGIARNIERRVHEEALKDIVTWRALWRYGGISLVVRDAPDLTCAAPDGRWIYFVEQVLKRNPA